MNVIPMSVTPAQASEWIANMAPLQRPPSNSHVRKLAADMKAGRWKMTHQAIAIDQNGRLIDGQHRLLAVVEAGVVVPMMVAFGVPPGSFDHVDMGMSRRVTDILRLRGYGEISSTHIAVVRQMKTGHIATGGKDRTLTTGEIELLLVKHREAIDFVISRAPTSSRGRLPSTVLGAVALAWNYEKDKDRLARFLEVMGDGMPRDIEADRCAVAFHTFCMSRRTDRSGSRAQRRSFFVIAQRAIKAHMQREPLTKFYEPKEPIYKPLSD